MRSNHPKNKKKSNGKFFLGALVGLAVGGISYLGWKYLVNYTFIH